MNGIQEIELRTHVTVEECKNRLINAVDKQKLTFESSGYVGSKEVLGRIQDKSFRLQVRRNNPLLFLAKCFYGRFMAQDGETVIVVRFRSHPDGIIFQGFWVVCLVSNAILALAIVLLGRTDVRVGLGRNAFIVSCVGSAVSVLVLTLLPHLRLRYGSRDDLVILRFLKTILDARESEQE